MRISERLNSYNNEQSSKKLNKGYPRQGTILTETFARMSKADPYQQVMGQASGSGEDPNHMATARAIEDPHRLATTDVMEPESRRSISLKAKMVTEYIAALMTDEEAFNFMENRNR